MSELLAGIRVIESASLFNGDALGMHLGDLGADVIKLESPFQGDYLRDFLGQITPHHSPAHMQVNKNKRSVAIDLRKPEGRELFWRLLGTADVFVDGNSSDACQRLGIGYEEQRKRRPEIVYCQYTGYGASGPYARIPTHGQMMNALVAATPTEKGEDGFLHEVPGGGAMGNMRSGGEGTAAGSVHAALHVAAALVHRQRTGRGCFIDVAGCDGVVLNAWIATTYGLNEHRIADRVGMPAREGGQNTGAKYHFYETRDGKALLFCCIEHKFWDKFCRAVGREDLLEQKDRSAPVDFGQGDALRDELRRIFLTRDLGEWVKLAAEHDVPMGPAPRTIPEMIEDPHVRSRELFHEGVHPAAGAFTYLGEAGKVAGQPYRVRRPAPALGQHTREILAELGVGAAELERLARDRIL